MSINEKVETLLNKMTIAEKIGQLVQKSGCVGTVPEDIASGKTGSLLNVVGDDAARMQKIACEESRLGIPLLFGRDVIHGLQTLFPIPLAQASSFNPDVVEKGSRVAATEAVSQGIHWTFAPMVDVSRDPRWGRIAESFGEDPYLSSVMGAAAVKGFQGERAEDGSFLEKEGIAACAKHYVGYGATQGGRDYNTTVISESELRNTYLSPFKACIDAGCTTVMSAFNDLNDVPTSGNAHTIREILKEEWGFTGMVVSDWNSVIEMIPHGFCADNKEAAQKAFNAGVDMEMVSPSYEEHLEELVEEGLVSINYIDDSVRRILRLKFELGLFDRPYEAMISTDVIQCAEHREAARVAAVESCVLIKNNDKVLPYDFTDKKIALIGPVADSAHIQCGTWSMDFQDKKEYAVTLREAMQASFKDFEYLAGCDCRNKDESQIKDAVALAERSDVCVVCVGEDNLLSGEAHCRSVLNLPGSQQQLLESIKATGKTVITVVLAGRPLIVKPVMDNSDALLWAWHPGSFGGQAIVDLLTGKEIPSGRMPVSFPKNEGQIPVFYCPKNTGRPVPEGQAIPVAEMGDPVDPVGFYSQYLDVDNNPEICFGYGLTYTSFEFGQTCLSSKVITSDEVITASVDITNTGSVAAYAVPQLYMRDIAASVTRPIKELKGFKKVLIQPGEKCKVSFDIDKSVLSFVSTTGSQVMEAGEFLIWIANDSSVLQSEGVQLTYKY